MRNDPNKSNDAARIGGAQIESWQEIRSLVARDSLDEALHQLRQLVDHQQFSLDIILLERQLANIHRDQRTNVLTRENAEAEKNRISQRILEIVNELDHPRRQYAQGRRVSALETRARARYLRTLRTDVENRLSVSIHNARFVDLGMEASPLATYLPWAYKNLDSSLEFASFEEAFETYDRRMLLLGAPGGGKTTTLLHIAIQLIFEAENDPTVPCPLIVNLSKFRPKSRKPSAFAQWEWLLSSNEKRDRQVQNWLAGELSKYPGISDLAHTWIENGCVAVLMDGLDEVDDEYRADLVKLLNATFLVDYPDIIVVICSRIHEYEPLQDRKETRLQLPGAVTLQPFNEEQINQYLEAARATGLREALPKDKSLYQMAQTPLTLSMMTLAYGGLAPSAVPSNLSLTQRRHHLMEAYVARMVERKERRDRNIPFDESEDNKVPTPQYKYSPGKLNRYLGWLAVCLSVRMQTAFSPDRFYQFLSRGIGNNQPMSGAWPTTISRALLISLGALIVGGVLMPLTHVGFLRVALISVLVAVLYVPAERVRRSNDKSLPARILASGAVGVVVVWCLGVISRALSAVLAVGVPPIEMGLIALCICADVVIITILMVERKSAWEIWFLGITVALFPTSAVAARLLGVPGKASLVLAVSLVAALGVFLASLVWSEGIVQAMAMPYVVGGLAGLQIYGVWIVGDLDWYDSAAAIAAVSLIVFVIDEESLLATAGVVLFSAFGGVLGRAPGAAVGAALFGLLCLMKFLIRPAGAANSAVGTFLEGVTGFLSKGIERNVDRYFFSPVLLSMLAFARWLPFRCRRFLGYSEEALIMRRTAGDLEFMHRLLRDYFALRDLQPRLNATNLDLRLEAIRSLGFQGESAIDSLAEFARNEDPSIREAAVFALGKIASPHVVPDIEAAVADCEPRVRRAAVLSIRNLRSQDAERLLNSAANDKDFSVQKAVLDITEHRSEYDNRERWSRMLAINENSRQLLEEVLCRVNRDNERIALFLPSWTKKFLEGLLASEKVKVRLGTVIVLGHKAEFADPSQIIWLFERDGNIDVRVAAARTLGRLGDGRAVEFLIKALSDRNKAVRVASAEGLGMLKDVRAVEPLIAALSSSQREMRKEAAKALGLLGDSRALGPLISTLSDREAGVGSATVRALRLLGDARAVEPLIKALSDRKASTRARAAQVLGHLGDERAVEPLIKGLSDREGSMRSEAAEALGRLGDARAAEPLIKGLSDREGSTRKIAAEALGRLGDARAVEPLIKALSDPHESTRGCAAEALGSLGDARAVEPLIKALSDPHESTRGSAAEALGSLGDASAVEPLIKAISDHGVVRLHAIEALGKLRDPRAVAPLTMALDGADFLGSWRAALALKEIGTPEAIAAAKKRDRG